MAGEIIKAIGELALVVGLGSVGGWVLILVAEGKDHARDGGVWGDFPRVPQEMQPVDYSREGELSPKVATGCSTQSGPRSKPLGSGR